MCLGSGLQQLDYGRQTRPHALEDEHAEAPRSWRLSPGQPVQVEEVRANDAERLEVGAGRHELPERLLGLPRAVGVLPLDVALGKVVVLEGPVVVILHVRV